MSRWAECMRGGLRGSWTSARSSPFCPAATVWFTSRRSPRSASSASAISSRKETWCASKCSRWTARVGSACRCAMSTRPSVKLTLAAFVMLAAAGPAAASSGEAGESPARPDGLYLDWLDRSVAPGTDFFRFANGTWLKTHPIPPDRSYWGIDTILDQQNQTFIRGLIERLGAEQSPEGSPQRKVADFYASGMDEAAIEAAGAAPLEAELKRIASIGDAGALPEEFAHLQSIGVAAPLSIGQMQDFKDSTQVVAVATQAGLGLPNRDYYLKSAPTFKAARAAYLEHVARMLELLGEPAAGAAREAKTVMALETRFADASMPDVEQRNPRAIYHPLTLDGAHALTPHLDWHQYLSRLGHPEIAGLNVAMPRFVQAVDREIAHTPIEDWKTYLRWQLIDAYAPYLSKAFVDEDFRMTAALNGAQELQPRWLRVLHAEDEALGFAIG